MKHNKGFTIIETLVAITILMIAIAGPLTVVHNGLNASIYARDQIVATFLAQDAIEFIKNKRDANIKQGIFWLTGITDDATKLKCNESPLDNCSIDTTNITEVYSSCGATTTCGVLYKNGSGYFNHLGGKVTQFNRYYSLNKKADDEYRIQVTVRWKTGTQMNRISLKDTMFNVRR